MGDHHLVADRDTAMGEQHRRLADRDVGTDGELPIVVDQDVAPDLGDGHPQSLPASGESTRFDPARQRIVGRHHHEELDEVVADGGDKWNFDVDHLLRHQDRLPEGRTRRLMA